MQSWQKTYGLSDHNFASERDALSAIFDAAHKRGTGNTNVFALRLQQGSFAFFMQQLGILNPGLRHDVARIKAAFGPTLFIHLSRRNKLNQAISLSKATQTGLWHIAPDGTELERQTPPQDPVYDADEIERNLVKLTTMDAAWKLWFSRENIAPLRIAYDELSADPTSVLASVLDRLGLDNKMESKFKLPVAKLADATSQNWAERFQAERRPPQNR